MESYGARLFPVSLHEWISGASVLLLGALSVRGTRVHLVVPPLVAPLANRYSTPSAMDSYNHLVLAILLLSYSTSTFAYFIPPIATTIVAYPTPVYSSTVYLSNGPSTGSPSGSSGSPSIMTSIGTTQRPRPPSKPPPIQSETSSPSEFVIFIDNPFVVASLILMVISLTVLFAVLWRAQRERRAMARKARRLPPPAPDIYMARPGGSLSIRNVAISSFGSPTLPRTPSPVMSFFSAQSPVSATLESDDIKQVQREVRGLSFVPPSRQLPPRVAVIVRDHEDAADVLHTSVE
ncbi:hypothetical protein MSAN_01129400 [Mycena sanguinolenta]|uniref:Transmembrane protein n=1 Tax=Mycena sanguinolenta TaxID=230812 RepID=A0A8H6YL02_9AGAR|nr:hypothetical protein MSAN_01129400 [Mycena sanguinolenta]